MYKKIENDHLLKDGEPVWNPTLAMHIFEQANLDCLDSDTDEDKLTEVFPEVVRMLHYLWRFQAEAGGGGIEMIVLQGMPHEIKGAYEALQVIGATKLATLLGYGIALVQSGGPEDEGWSPEFSLNKRHSEWFAGFKDTGEYEDISALDVKGGVYDLVSELDPLVVAYVKDNLEEIVR